ncbi:hypothetical protein HK100_012523 [Physocladia obscura]|uniref:Uncharacterized protein n=1 Tax=Physocladia obscura TaxID=109957 RepID=A0AAD5SZK7_9FUNG|nr:hypothetical protein HK100_012523 [Physocladia obscura]
MKHDCTQIGTVAVEEAKAVAVPLDESSDNAVLRAFLALTAMNKGISKSWRFWTGALVGCGLQFAVVGVIIAVSPIPSRHATVLAAVFSVLVALCGVTAIYWFARNKNPVLHPLPLTFFISGLQLAASLVILVSMIVVLAMPGFTSITRYATTYVLQSQVGVMILVCIANLIYTNQVVNKHPEIARLRRIARAQTRRPAQSIKIMFTMYHMYTAALIGTLINLVTLFAVYGVYTSDISTSLLVGELVGQIIVSFLFLVPAVLLYKYRNDPARVAANKIFTESSSAAVKLKQTFELRFLTVRAVWLGMALGMLLDLLVIIFTFVGVTGSFAPDGSLFDRIAIVLVIPTLAVVGFGYIGVIGYMLYFVRQAARKAKLAVAANAPS